MKVKNLFIVLVMLYVSISSLTLVAQSQEIVSSYRLFQRHDGKTPPVNARLTQWLEGYLRSIGVKTLNCQRDLGLTVNQTYALFAKIGNAVVQPDLDNDRTGVFLDMALLIRKTAEEEMSNYLKSQTLNITPDQLENLTYLSKFYAFEYWIETHVEYSDDFANLLSKGGTLPDFREIMKSERPATVCGGLSWGVIHFSALADLERVYKIEGGGRGGENGTHSWVAAQLPKGSSWIFADPTRGCIPLQEARRRQGLTFHPFSVPVESWTQGAFLYAYCSAAAVIGGVKMTDGRDVYPKFLYNARNANGKLSDNSQDVFTRKSWAIWAAESTILEWNNFYGFCGTSAHDR